MNKHDKIKLQQNYLISVFFLFRKFDDYECLTYNQALFTLKYTKKSTDWPSIML